MVVNIQLHTHVDIDDFDCPKCQRITQAELSLRSGKYHCFKCGEDY